MDKQTLVRLLQRYISRNITDTELADLATFIHDPKNSEMIKEALAETGMMMTAVPGYDAQRFDPILKKVLSADKPAPAIPLYRRKIFRWAVAASILFVLVVTVWLTIPPKKQDNVTIAKQDVESPKSTKAVITLVDGRTIILDSINAGTLARQSDVTLTKTPDGKIVYSQLPGGRNDEMEYNTLTNPPGSKVVDMILSDGSHVWLNAGSSVTYPVAFVGDDRKVSMTGEAYFEITHDKTKPFFVSKGDMKVQVLGTRFNVNAYDDEAEIKVTLLEGSVKVSNNIQSMMIKPGGQVRQTAGNTLEVSDAVDLEKTMAWKNNEFIFDDDNLEEIMRQLSRWYNIHTVFKGASSTNYTGRITRTVALSQVLNMFERIGYIKFEINGRDVKVTPVN